MTLSQRQGEALARAGFLPSQIAQHRAKFANLFRDVPLSDGRAIDLCDVNELVQTLERQNRQLRDALCRVPRGFVSKDVHELLRQLEPSIQDLPKHSGRDAAL